MLPNPLSLGTGSRLGIKTWDRVPPTSFESVGAYEIADYMLEAKAPEVPLASDCYFELASAGVAGEGLAPSGLA